MTSLFAVFIRIFQCITWVDIHLIYIGYKSENLDKPNIIYFASNRFKKIKRAYFARLISPYLKIRADKNI